MKASIMAPVGAVARTLCRVWKARAKGDEVDRHQIAIAKQASLRRKSRLFSPGVRV